MIEQTVSLEDLTSGLARCVREWLAVSASCPLCKTAVEIRRGALEVRAERPSAAAKMSTTNTVCWPKARW